MKTQFKLFQLFVLLMLTFAAESAFARSWYCYLTPISCKYNPDNLQPAQPIIDEKIYAGKQCRPVDGKLWGDFTSGLAIFKNNSSSTREVTCPVVRDSSERLDGIKLFAVEVFNPIYGKRLTCFLWSLNGEGKIVSSASVSSINQGKLYLFNDNAISTSRFSGEYTITCNLPPKSGIMNYKVHELLGYTK